VASAAQYAKSTPMSWNDFFLNIVPDNFFGSFAKGELLQVLVIAVLFGIALLAIKPDRRRPILESLNRMSECFFELINVIMKLAPIGAFGAIAAAVGQQGLATIVALGQLIAIMWIVAAVFVVVVLGIIGRFYGLNILRFLRYIKDEIFIVLGTSSSESVLPRLLEKLERFGCTKQTVGLVLPTGYAFNLDGTAIYMSLGVVFIANAYGVTLNLHQQLGILALMMLSSKGAATVAGGTFVTFASIIAATGILPLQGVAVLFGVLRMRSPAVSVCNIIGNSVATVVIAKSSNEFDETAARQEYVRVLGRSADMPL
jgi:aerobic C4-dicarboxylate transport protein